VLFVVLSAACSSSGTSSVEDGQARVSKAETAVSDAQATVDKTTKQFCGDTKDYIAALDRYGKVFDNSAATVGDVKTGGADLENPRAFALEATWLQLFNEAGCLTAEEQQKAATAIHDYTVAVQTDLRTAGYYSDEIDGVYGPSTAAAVQQLQTANGLKPTGWVDRATGAALDAALAAKGGAAATQALTHTAAVQSALKLAGYWTGPVDGQWTPELTDALMRFQTDLGVRPQARSMPRRSPPWSRRSRRGTRPPRLRPRCRRPPRQPPPARPQPPQRPTDRSRECASTLSRYAAGRSRSRYSSTVHPVRSSYDTEPRTDSRRKTLLNPSAYARAVGASSHS
jgi:peptidoglycan hydrolase-like protein with peptidoglycan-binding domain